MTAKSIYRLPANKHALPFEPNLNHRCARFSFQCRHEISFEAQPFHRHFRFFLIINDLFFSFSRLIAGAMIAKSIHRLPAISRLYLSALKFPQKRTDSFLSILLPFIINTDRNLCLRYYCREKPLFNTL